MSEYRMTVEWKRNEAKFTDLKYSREHQWTFDGGLQVLASSSPHVVPLPYSNPAGVDPEEAFVAALSSCHMLSFLYVAAKRKFLIESYTDNAVGKMEKNAEGRLAVTKVTLNPEIKFGGEKLPTREEIGEMHEMAHHECFIANSVKTDVVIAFE